MRTIETFYLIDYENVGAGGLNGCEKLKKTDHVMIFFTNNARKIDMNVISDLGDADLRLQDVPSGKQSADIHIGSYLGYLAGKSEGKDCKVVIISNDTDYDNVIKFWIEKTGIKASRAQAIGASKGQPQADRKENSKSTTSKNATVKPDGNTKTQLNKEIMQALSTAGYESTVVNNVSKIAAGLFGEEHFSVEVHNALQLVYTNSRELYTVIKPVLAGYDTSLKNSQAKAKKDSVHKRGSANERIGNTSKSKKTGTGRRRIQKIPPGHQG